MCHLNITVLFWIFFNCNAYCVNRDKSETYRESRLTRYSLFRKTQDVKSSHVPLQPFRHGKTASVQSESDCGPCSVVETHTWGPTLPTAPSTCRQKENDSDFHLWGLHAHIPPPSFFVTHIPRWAVDDFSWGSRWARGAWESSAILTRFALTSQKKRNKSIRQTAVWWSIFLTVEIQIFTLSPLSPW